MATFTGPLIFIQVAALFSVAACQTAEWIGSFPEPTEPESRGGTLASIENENDWQSLGGDFSSQPTSTCKDGHLFVFGLSPENKPLGKNYKENDDADRVQWGVGREKDGEEEKNKLRFSSKWFDHQSRVVALSAASTRDRVFLLGRRIGNAYFVKVRSSRGWLKWKNLGGPFFSDPVVATDGNKVVVAARGRKNQVFVRIHSGNSWGKWRNIGGDARSDPAVTIKGKETHVFVLGWKNDLQYAGFANGKWSKWMSFGARLMFHPKAITTPNGDVHVFVVGSTNGLYSKVRKANGNWAEGWYNLKGVHVSPPDLAVSKDGTIHVVSRSGKNDLIYRKMAKGKWEDSEVIATDGFPASTPSATICDGEDLFVFVRGEENAFFVKDVESSPSLSSPEYHF